MIGVIERPKMRLYPITGCNLMTAKDRVTADSWTPIAAPLLSPSFRAVDLRRSLLGMMLPKRRHSALHCSSERIGRK
jgi:hypothetical protein